VGEPYNRNKSRDVGLEDLAEADREKVKAMPNPAPLLTFADAVRQRKHSGGDAEARIAPRRSCTREHRHSRRPQDSVRSGERRIIGDDEANRLINQPMRAPWHL